ncbi:TonB-dependent receptor [Tsuneonella sp. YG55]|uniref:TonB-dependent receptor n=1 Tax=Tsuneonella litorea TaxID=2976475 RepID=A0A9X2W410_9SPHN|nr:TonB-dependent receptor [Tsuneonella litorea]MCT2560233.1 TonB-dependent receptor [Tsuneonella litorea]
MKFYLGSGVALLTLCSGAAAAADVAGEPTTPLDDPSAPTVADPTGQNGDRQRSEEIIVTATRVPTPITAIPNTVRVLDRETVTTQLAVSPSLIDSLSFSIPSLAPGRQRMTSTGESLRGRTPLYMVDGIPQTTPLRDGKRSGFTIDPAFVNRVEVIYGANAIQGLGATGGVINYVTVRPKANGDWLRRATAEISTDDFEENGFHYRTSALAGRQIGAFDFVLGGAFERNDLFYDGADRPVVVDPTQGDIMDSKSWSFFSRVGYALDADQRIELMANLFKLEGDGDYEAVPGNALAGIPATSIAGDPAGDPTRNDAKNFAATYRHGDLLGGTLSLQGFYYDFYALYGGDTFPVFQDPAIAPVGTLFDQSALGSKKYGAKLTFSREDALWHGLQVIAGADYLRDRTNQELAQTGRLWVPNLIYRGWAPFVQLEQRLLGDAVRVSGGVRWENVTLDVPDFTTIASSNSTFVEGGSPSFDTLLKNAGIVVEPLEGLSVFASYAQGFTMPDAGLILRAVRTPGQNVEDLVDLQPVIADNIELGSSWRRGGLDLSASYFWSNSDLGSRIQVIGGAGVIQRERTEIQGLELSASYAFDSGARFGAAFAALDGRYDSNGDGVVDRDLDGRNIAPDRLNLFAESPLFGKLSGRVQVSRLFDRRFDGGAPRFDFDGYTLVDLILSYDSDDAGRFTLGIANLLDEQYVTYTSQTANFINDRNYSSGRGRAFTLRWQGNF